MTNTICAVATRIFRMSLSRGELKSLALHRSLAAKVQADPSLLRLVRKRLQWLRGKNPAGDRYYDRWSQLVDGRLEHLLAVMTDDSEDSCALRQESPFVDLVDQKERARIYRGVAEEFDRRRAS